MNGDSLPRRVLASFFGVDPHPALHLRPPATAGYSVARRTVAGLLGVKLPKHDRTTTYAGVEKRSDGDDVQAVMQAIMDDISVDALNSKSADAAEPVSRPNKPEEFDTHRSHTLPHPQQTVADNRDTANAKPTTPIVAPGRSLTGQDDTTRYLRAAAHLDYAYADAAIREFVVEPTRPVPPSAGYDPASVLAEAIASRTRRKLRDGALALLMIAFVALAWASWLPYAWIGVALVIAVPSLVRAAVGSTRFGVLVTASYVGLVVGGFLVFGVLSGGIEDIFGSSYGSSLSYGSRDGDLRTGLSVIPLLLMLAILVSDRVVVWNLLASRFSYGARHRSPNDPFDANRRLLDFSPALFRRNLQRYRNAAPGPEGSAPLIVHRGYNPFVGAGDRYKAWSMALPLEKLDLDTEPDSSPVEELTTVLLYKRIREALGRLQNNSALSPDRRLRDLRITEGIYVSSDQLIDHLSEPASVPYLSRLSDPPHAYLQPEEVAVLRGEPREWARYYLCFEVKTWDRDLVISTFLHAAADNSTLYLEWTPCVLPPIRDAYREVDKMAPGFARPAWQGVVRWLKLPVSIISRTVHTLALIRPLPRRPGWTNPDAYGNLRTLREMAAAPDVSRYFQLIDIERYQKIMHSRLLPAISQTLRDCGYSPAQFEKQAAQVTSNTFIGDISGPGNADVVHGTMTATTVATGKRIHPPARNC